MKHEQALNIIKDPKQIVKKRSLLLSGHQTSVTLEDSFWLLLKEIAHEQNQSLNRLVTEIDNQRVIPLSSALRLYCLHYVLDQ